MKVFPLINNPTNEIINNTESGDLKSLLTEASPLSDSVLKVLNVTTTVLSIDSLVDIFIRNSPLSQDLIIEIINNSETLDSISIQAILAIQGIDTMNHTLTGLNRRISALNVDRQKVLSDLIYYYIDNDSTDEGINLLRSQNNETENQLLFSTFLSLNLLDSAEYYYAILEESTTLDPDWIAVQGILLALAQNGLDVFDMDSIQHADLYEIAEKSFGSLATANARSILHLVFNEEFEDDFDSGGELKTILPPIAINNQIVQANTNLAFLKLFPNPAKETVTITYNFSRCANHLNSKDT